MLVVAVCLLNNEDVAAQISKSPLKYNLEASLLTAKSAFRGDSAT